MVFSAQLTDLRGWLQQLSSEADLKVPINSNEITTRIMMIGVIIFLEGCGNRNGGRQKMMAIAKLIMMIVDMRYFPLVRCGCLSFCL
jgi:hypothetical protein